MIESYTQRYSYSHYHRFKESTSFRRFLKNLHQKPCFYSGSLVSKISSLRFSEEIEAGGSTTFNVNVPAADYLKLMTKSGDLKVSLLGGCHDQEQAPFVSQVIVDVQKPTIDIQVID